MLALPIILLGLLSSTSALVLPRHRALARAPTPVDIAVRAEATAPADWTSHKLEDYETYHIRYMALDCEDQHNTTFFTSCCHPRSASNTTAIAAACTPSAKALASALAEYGPDDCEETSSAASATAPATATAPAAESTEECSGEETSSAKATSTSKTAAASTSKAAATAAKGGAGALGQGAPTTTSPSKAAATSTAPESSSKAESTSSKEATATKAASTSTKEATSTKTSSSAATATAATGSAITGGVATYYTQGGQAGACGDYHSDSDFIAAIDQDRYGSSSSKSSLCGKQVKITNTSNQKTVTVTIADDCPTCKNSNSIDLSEAAFKQIATISQGEVDISWEFL